jgi:hypothetical protein
MAWGHTSTETEDAKVRRWLWVLLLVPLIVFAILVLTNLTLQP